MLSLPFGKPYELGQNTSSCRNIHQNMVPLRPSVHCFHIGPYIPRALLTLMNRSGGGKCIPREYVEVTTEKYFLNSFADPLALH